MARNTERSLPSWPESMSTATVSKIAGAIWRATVRFQISEYRRNCSGSKLLFYVAGQHIRRRRANSLVRFLGVPPLRLGAKHHARLFRKPGLSVDNFARSTSRVARPPHRQVEPVGAHVGDETHLALADVLAFTYNCCAVRMVFCALKPNLRAASCCRVEVVNGGAGLRLRCLRSTLSTVNSPLAASFRVRSTSRACCSVVKLNCSTLVPWNSISLPGNFCSECLEFRIDGPVFARHERRNFVLAAADHAQSGTLHAARGQSRAHFLPQQGREIESHQKIQGAPGLLGIHQVDRQLTGTRHRLANRVLGDLIEDHALDFFVLEFTLSFEELVQVPRNGFALAIGVGREKQRLGLLEGARYGVDVFLVAFDHLILHGEVVRRVDGAFLRHEVANATVRKQGLRSPCRGIS